MNRFRMATAILLVLVSLTAFGCATTTDQKPSSTAQGSLSGDSSSGSRASQKIGSKDAIHSAFRLGWTATIVIMNKGSDRSLMVASADSLGVPYPSSLEDFSGLGNSLSQKYGPDALTAFKLGMSLIGTIYADGKDRQSLIDNIKAHYAKLGLAPTYLNSFLQEIQRASNFEQSKETVSKFVAEVDSLLEGTSSRTDNSQQGETTRSTASQPSSAPKSTRADVQSAFDEEGDRVHLRILQTMPAMQEKIQESGGDVSKMKLGAALLERRRNTTLTER